jgi:hypothetical protein
MTQVFSSLDLRRLAPKARPFLQTGYGLRNGCTKARLLLQTEYGLRRQLHFIHKMLCCFPYGYSNASHTCSYAEPPQPPRFEERCLFQVFALWNAPPAAHCVHGLRVLPRTKSSRYCKKGREKISESFEISIPSYAVERGEFRI